MTSTTRTEGELGYKEAARHDSYVLLTRALVISPRGWSYAKSMKSWSHVTISAEVEFVVAMAQYLGPASAQERANSSSTEVTSAIEPAPKQHECVN